MTEKQIMSKKTISHMDLLMVLAKYDADGARSVKAWGDSKFARTINSALSELLQSFVFDVLKESQRK